MAAPAGSDFPNVGEKKEGEHVPTKPKPKPKHKKSTAAKANKNVNPDKMELDENEGFSGDDIFDNETGRLPKEEQAYAILKKKYDLLLRRKQAADRENEDLIRDNEILQREIQDLGAHTSRVNSSRDEVMLEDSDDDDMDPMLGGRQMNAGGKESKEMFDRVDGEFSAEDARKVVLVGDPDDNKERVGPVDGVKSGFLSELRAQRRRARKAHTKTFLDFGKAMVAAARQTQLNVKVGQGGIPLNLKQAIAASNAGDAPGLPHLAVVGLARGITDDGQKLAMEVRESDTALALEIALAHMAEADNVIALLVRGLSEDVLFGEQVAPVSEYQYLIDQVNSGRDVETDLLRDAKVERTLQIVRSRGKQTRAVYDHLQSSSTLPSMNSIIFGETTALYRPDSAYKPDSVAAKMNEKTNLGATTSADGATMGVSDNSGKFCHYFQRKSGCKKGAACKYAAGHICSNCGSRNHGAHKHSSKSRYQPYKK